MAKKNISRLQFISLDLDEKSHSQQAHEFILGGGNWIQLRVKNTEMCNPVQEASKSLSVCFESESTLIINDNVELAYNSGAAGVHLGKSDMSPLEARQILGELAIIGGTANTFEDVQRLVEQGVDYVGLGPFKYTSTKKNLSPVLGLKGYESILNQCRDRGVSIPIIAIGGIEPSDIKDLMSTGIYGIAISSWLAKHENTATATLELLEELGKWVSHFWTKSIAK